MVRREAFPLSGDAGIGDIRDMIVGEHDPGAGRRAGRPRDARRSSTTTSTKVLSFIDPASIKPFNVVLDAGSGMAGLVAPQLFDRLPCKTTRLCFDDRRHVSRRTRRIRSSKKTAATSSSA